MDSSESEQEPKHSARSKHAHKHRKEGKDEEKGGKREKKVVNDVARFTEKEIKLGMKNAASHHVESFNYALKVCLPRICEYMLRVELTD